MASTIAGYIGKINPGDGTDYSVGSTAYGVCGTAAATAAKTVEMTGFTLVTGATIFVKFTYANSASNPTLNVNSTGAKAIVQYGTTAAGTSSTTSGWNAGAVVALTYDGTSWVRDQGYNTNTTYSVATTSANGLMSATDKTKLDGVATGAQVNQNAFSNIVVGDTTIAADTTTDSVTFVAGSNVTLTPDATNDKLTIAATDTTYSAATTSAAGLMSASDKTKLDGVATGATANTGTVTSITLKATSPIAIDSTSAITTSGTRTLSHADSGATAGSYGDSAAQTPAYGGTFKVPYVTVNATGHVTGISEHTVKIPASDNTDTKVTSAASTANGNYPIHLNNGTSATTSTVLMDTDVYVNPSTGNLGVTKINGVTVGSSPKFTDTVTTVSTSGSGNAVTAISASSGALTVTKGTTFLTSHQDISGKENSSNKVTSLSSSSTDTQYPSAKCVYDLIGNLESLLAAL